MKRTYCALLSLLLVAGLAMTGCGSDNDTPSPQTTATTTPETVTQDTLPPTEEETTVPPADENKVEPTTLGTLEGNVYTNTYVGIGCEFGDKWEVAIADELQDIPDAVSDMLKDTELGEVVSAYPQIMDMQAQNTETGTSINVLYTQMDKNSRQVYKLMDEEKIIDTLLINKDLLIKTYAQSGIDVQSMEKSTASFLGETHTVSKTIASVDGVDLYIVQVLDYKLPGQYGATITFTGMSESEIENAMSGFYKVD